ncbi:MAG: hypothetical protein A2076_04635 [Geobacteraceae bacterium GWC2_53_11]|nr:MAG: hypothetical protein A2076_04635 [Geobacteraceae bacterium GWC2_53_11]
MLFQQLAVHQYKPKQIQMSNLQWQDTLFLPNQRLMSSLPLRKLRMEFLKNWQRSEEQNCCKKVLVH